MFTFLKQYFCRHESICTTTDMSSEGLIIAKTLIQCERCNKSFPQHPHAQCCYVMHVHADILKEQFIQQYKRGQQS